MTTRASGRAPDDLRAVVFVRDFTEMADGSVLVDSAETAARALEATLPPGTRRGAGEPGRAGETHILVTDASERLARIAGRFLGREAARLELVDLP